MNLAENAAKLTGAGRIVLSAADVGGGAVEIAVSDTGPGIAPAERTRVFGRFYRASADSPGFGLGLAIVRAVAYALDGDLELESEVGSGTTIRLRLPKAAVYGRPSGTVFWLLMMSPRSVTPSSTRFAARASRSSSAPKMGRRPFRRRSTRSSMSWSSI